MRFSYDCFFCKGYTSRHIVYRLWFFQQDRSPCNLFVIVFYLELLVFLRGDYSVINGKSNNRWILKDVKIEWHNKRSVVNENRKRTHGCSDVPELPDSNAGRYRQWLPLSFCYWYRWMMLKSPALKRSIQNRLPPTGSAQQSRRYRRFHPFLYFNLVK